MKSQITREFERVSPKIRFNQGDILRDISLKIQTDYDEEKGALIDEINLSYAIIISQECDLEHDFNSRNGSTTQDKYLPNILLLPAYKALSLKSGTHRGDEIKGEIWDTKRWDPIKNNNNYRFHYIKENTDLQLPELVIDFKHVYTISRDYIYKDISKYYLVSVCELYRELISQRYAYFLSRIGLPNM